jgi:hypothetical protein
MPGTHIGYIRVRPLKEGPTQITLEGANMDVEVARDTAASTLDMTRPEKAAIVCTRPIFAMSWAKSFRFTWAIRKSRRFCLVTIFNRSDFCGLGLRATGYLDDASGQAISR